MILRHRFAPHAVATALFLAAFANVFRGTSYSKTEYRLWSFEHHAYSDSVAMSNDRYSDGERPLPYFEDRIEYPVLLGVFGLWLPSFAPGGSAGRFIVTSLMAYVCLLLTVSVLLRIEGANVWWIAAFVPLIQYALLNFDFLAIGPMVLAVHLYATGRARSSGFATAAATWVKLFPAVLVPAATTDLIKRRDFRGLVNAAGAFLLFSIMVNLPFALLARDNWGHFFRYSTRRGGEGLWFIMGFSDWKALNALTFLLLGAAVVFACVCAYRMPSQPTGPEATRSFRLNVAFILCAWILTNKTEQPQYILYVAVAGAVAGAPLWLMIPVALIGVLEFHIAFDALTPADKRIGLANFWHTMQVSRAFIVQFVLLWLGVQLWQGARWSLSSREPRDSSQPANA